MQMIKITLLERYIYFNSYTENIKTTSLLALEKIIFLNKHDNILYITHKIMTDLCDDK